jgi:acyl-coenzyme A synthetase/AMP-(fatty) acid ligase
MGDRVVFHDDGSFSLCGRADQIAKVEGKRFSLTEMNGRLQEHPWVADARVLVVTSKREEVAAVIALTPSGEQALIELGKLGLNQGLREYLLAFFERPLLPRRWRYLAELPTNSQGKVTMRDLQTLLAQREPS